MKKMYIILGIMMILIASAVAASVSVTYNFRDIQTWQPLGNVDTLVYPCIDAGCNVLNLAMPLPGSGNSGSSSQATIVYPTAPVTPYGYAAYYFAHGFAPQEYLATWHGNGATTYNVNFNKIENCKSDITNFDEILTPNANGAVVALRATVESAFSDPHNYIGYVLPQYADEYYSSQIEARFMIYNSSNVLVYSNTQSVNVFMDTLTEVSSGIATLGPGTYRAEVETVVTDNQCSNSLTRVQTEFFTIEAVPPLEAALTANPTSGVEPLDVTFTCSADGGIAPYTFTFHSDDSSGQSTVTTGQNMGDYQQFFVTGYMAGTYNPWCEVTDSVGTTDNSNTVTIIVAPQPPVNNPPVVNLISPPNGSTIIISQIGDNTLYFTYNVTDDLSDVLNCTLYTNLTGDFEAEYSQLTPNNTVDFFVMLTTNVPDGTYIWNVECSDGQLSAFAPENSTFTINTTLPPMPECSDGIDNDGDGLIDFPNDPGCYNANDDNETDEVIVCENHLDISNVYITTTSIPEGAYVAMFTNSVVGQGYIPFNYNFTNSGNSEITGINYTMSMTSNQTGEVSSETSAIPVIAPNTSHIEGDDFNHLIDPLVDGLYNMSLSIEGVDGNGCIQYDKFNFYIVFTTLNIDYECSDGMDNDGDGLIDAFDPGCYDSGVYDPMDDDENNTLPECSDYFDNDGDSLIDWPADPGCVNASDDNETDSVALPECSDGIDNDGDLLIDFPADPGCTDTNDDNETDAFVCTDHLNISRVYMDDVRIFEFLTYPMPNADVSRGYMDLDNFFTNTEDSTISNTSYMAGLFNTANSTDGHGYTYYLPSINPYSTVLDSRSFNLTGIQNGTYEMLYIASGLDSHGCEQADSFRFYLIVNTSENVTYECSDAFDNDGDSFIDAADPGCYDTGSYNPFDDNETDTLLECSDYFDNDGDGLIDWPADPGCVNAADDNETDIIILPECSDGIDNDLDSLIDFPLDPGCENATDDDETNGGNQTNQAPTVVLFFPFNGMIINESDIPFMYLVFDDATTWLNCTLYSNISGAWQPEQSLLTLNGFAGVMYEQSIPDGTYAWNVECSDGQLSAFAPENWTFTIVSGTPIFQCNDGVDNDGDGLIDYPNDIGCDSPQDNNETNIVALPQCSDGIDNDGDGLVDMADPGCQNADDNEESGGQSTGGDEIEEILDPEQILYIGHIDVHSTTNAGFEQELARIGDEVEVSVYIENLASYNLYDLKMSVYIDNLGVWRTIGPFDLLKGEHITKHVYMDIPDDSEPGTYDIRIVVANEDVKRVKYRLVKVIA